MELNTGDMSLYDSIDAFADAIMNMEEENDTHIKLTGTTNTSLPDNIMVTESEVDRNMKSSGTSSDLDDIDVNMKAFDVATKDSDNDCNSVNNKISTELDLEKDVEINPNEVSNVESKESKHVEGESRQLEEDSSNAEKQGNKSDGDDAGHSTECDESSRESDSRRSRLEENPSRCTNGDLEDKSNDDDSRKESITQDKKRIEYLTEIDKDIRKTEQFTGNNVTICKVCNKCKVKSSDVKDKELGEEIFGKDKDKCVQCNCEDNKDTERQNTTDTDKLKSKENEINCSQESKESECTDDNSKNQENPESIETMLKGTNEAKKQDLDDKNNTKSKSKVKEVSSDDETKKEHDDKTDDDDDDDVVELPQQPVKCISVDSEDSEGPAESYSSNTAAPVFVEIGVETILGRNVPSPPESPNDCMMIVENVQVDIDPSSLMMNYDEDDDEQQEESDDDFETCEVVAKKPAEPVSLLTSSDEDDVILQEPHIDTVDVSDETDEDDVPLTRLVKPGDKAEDKPGNKKKKKKAEKALSDIFWGKNNEVYCYLCKFVTKQRAALARHMAEQHAGSENPNKTMAIQVCSQCNFQSASKSQFFRHMRKHKAEKSFKCALCDYRAKHKMSLVYHMKSHRELATYKCKKCPFRANSKTLIQKHLKVHSLGGMLQCSQCDFRHRTADALKQHVRRKHKDKSKTARAARRRARTEEDDEYVPGMKM